MKKNTQKLTFFTFFPVVLLLAGFLILILSDTENFAYILLGVGLLLNAGVSLYYVFHAANNKKILSGDKFLWIICLLIGSAPASVAYWFFRISGK